jgi:hypothetical protein
MKEPGFETEDVIDYRMGFDRCRPARARSGHRAELIPRNRFSFRNIAETRSGGQPEVPQPMRCSANTLID